MDDLLSNKQFSGFIDDDKLRESILGLFENTQIELDTSKIEKEISQIGTLQSIPSKKPKRAICELKEIKTSGNDSETYEVMYASYFFSKKMYSFLSNMHSSKALWNYLKV